MPDRIHDRNLLDTLEQCPPEPFEGQVSRIAREGRDPLAGGYNGRWNDDQLPALYAALEADTAIAEMRYHLSRHPVFPSRLRFNLYALQVSTRRTLKLLNLNYLKAVGVPIDLYATQDYAQAKRHVYPTTQAIGAAAAFLEFDGLLVPSARREGATNLVLFGFDQIGATVIEQVPVSLR
jgi:RES domain-containing protein